MRPHSHYLALRARIHNFHVTRPTKPLTVADSATLSILLPRTVLWRATKRETHESRLIGDVQTYFQSYLYSPFVVIAANLTHKEIVDLSVPRNSRRGLSRPIHVAVWLLPSRRNSQPFRSMCRMSFCASCAESETASRITSTLDSSSARIRFASRTSVIASSRLTLTSSSVLPCYFAPGNSQQTYEASGTF